MGGGRRNPNLLFGFLVFACAMAVAFALHRLWQG